MDTNNIFNKGDIAYITINDSNDVNYGKTLYYEVKDTFLGQYHSIKDYPMMAIDGCVYDNIVGKTFKKLKVIK